MEYLYKYIKEENATIARTIRIREEIGKWKRSNTGREPEILIDLEQFRNVFAQRDETGVVLGGRYQIYNKLFERFLNDLVGAKVKLRFIVAAHQTTDDLNLFIPLMEDEYYRRIELMNKLTLTAGTKHFGCGTIMPTTINSNLIAIAKTICTKYSLHVCSYRHVQEIAQYTKAHSGNVLAIISNDLHLLLVEGAHQFWYANDINLKTLNITLFCRNALITSTGLAIKQLQLLSVLLGSPYVPSYITEPFLMRIDQAQGESKVLALSKYIKQNSMGSDFELGQIAHDVFSPSDSNAGINAIENGLNAFSTEFSISITNYGESSEFYKQRNPFIYQLLTDDVYLWKDIAFVDYRTSRCENWCQLNVSLLQKMIGTLFKENLIRPMDRKICMKFAHDEPYRIVKIPIVYPTDVIPWTLASWMFNLDRRFCDELKKISSEYETIVLTLHYLIQHKIINILEADAILFSEFQVRSKVNVPNIPYPKSINIDFVQIAHLYTKTLALVNQCLIICGLTSHGDLIKFDGPIFYSTLESWLSTKMQAESLKKFRSQVQVLRIYADE